MHGLEADVPLAIAKSPELSEPDCIGNCGTLMGKSSSPRVSEGESTRGPSWQFALIMLLKLHTS